MILKNRQDSGIHEITNWFVLTKVSVPSFVPNEKDCKMPLLIFRVRECSQTSIKITEKKPTNARY